MAIGGMTISISLLRNKNGLAVRATPTGRTAKKTRSQEDRRRLHQIRTIAVRNDPDLRYRFRST